MKVSSQDVKSTLLASFLAAERHSDPYAWFMVRDCLPDAMLKPLRDLPFPAPALEGVSGTREAHNKSRNYFDADARAEHEVCAALADALQDPEIVSAVERTFSTDLSNTSLRIEYGQDTDGFWLEPHTDIGVKNFTMLLYLSDGPGHETLGTSIYADRDTHVGETPFAPNAAMVF
ncbi:2OG-Fe(II) oxygenase, partial [Rhizobiaceae bacterium]|nr:2OG-Fe(II) oxygenase [Rhizobiaceae bacterium]